MKSPLKEIVGICGGHQIVRNWLSSHRSVKRLGTMIPNKVSLDVVYESRGGGPHCSCLALTESCSSQHLARSCPNRKFEKQVDTKR